MIKKSNAKMFDAYLKLKKVIKSVKTIEQYEGALRMKILFDNLYMEWGNKEGHHHSIDFTLAALLRGKKSKISNNNNK